MDVATLRKANEAADRISTLQHALADVSRHVNVSVGPPQRGDVRFDERTRDAIHRLVRKDLTQQLEAAKADLAAL